MFLGPCSVNAPLWPFWAIMLTSGGSSYAWRTGRPPPIDQNLGLWSWLREAVCLRPGASFHLKPRIFATFCMKIKWTKSFQLYPHQGLCGCPCPGPRWTRGALALFPPANPGSATDADIAYGRPTIHSVNHRCRSRGWDRGRGTCPQKFGENIFRAIII